MREDGGREGRSEVSMKEDIPRASHSPKGDEAHP